MQAKRQWSNTFEVWKEKEINLEFYTKKLSFKIEGIRLNIMERKTNVKHLEMQERVQTNNDKGDETRRENAYTRMEDTGNGHEEIKMSDFSYYLNLLENLSIKTNQKI